MKSEPFLFGYERTSRRMQRHIRDLYWTPALNLKANQGMRNARQTIEWMAWKCQSGITSCSFTGKLLFVNRFFLDMSVLTFAFLTTARKKKKLKTVLLCTDLRFLWVTREMNEYFAAYLAAHLIRFKWLNASNSVRLEWISDNTKDLSSFEDLSV